MLVTIFNSKKTKGKSPISPYDDLTFDFKSFEVEKITDFFRIMCDNFILNLPITKSLRTYRRKTNLKDLYPKTFDYIILDIDKVKTPKDRNEILKYFKNYECLLGDSKSANGVDNFNLKGILKIEPLSLDNIKILVEQLAEDLKMFGDLDNSTSKMVSLNAPINKFNILLEGKGEPYKFVYRPSYKSKDLTEILNNNFEIPKIKIENAKTIDQLCLQVFQQMGFEALKSNGSCILFKHPSEMKTPGGYFWFKDSPYTMHHYNDQKTINLFAEITKLPEAKELLKKDINYDDKLLNFNISTNVISVNSPLLKVTNDIKSAINSFILQKDGLFAIKSPMGTGKSVIISEIITEALEQDMRVLVCTNRISVAEDFTQKYGLKIYNKDKYKSNDSIIVQYDSLWRYNIKNFDLIVFDEFISLLLHSRNNLNNTVSNIAKFFSCFNKKLVIADAFLTGYENCMLANKKENLWLLYNEYRDNTNLYTYNNYNFFIQNVLAHARKERITISCTSLTTIFSLKLLLSKYGLKVVTLTAETPKMTKDLIYKLFQQSKNEEYDVLIYSPTLTVGVSNLNDINTHFHYDSSSSCDVISSLQMVKRTRKAKEIHLYIKNKIRYLKTTYKELKDEYLQNIGKFVEHNYIFELNDYGEVKLSKLGKKAISIDVFKNILESNHKNAFMYFLNYQFKNEPKIISKTYDINILLPYIHAYKNDNDRYKLECLDEYLSISNIDRNCILDFRKQELFDILSDVETKLTDDAPKNEILKIALTEKNFFDKLFKYKTLIKYQKGEIEKIDIQRLISDSLKTNKEDLKYWNAVLKFDSPLLDVYVPSAIKDNKKLKMILDGCGYKLQQVGMLKKYCVDKNIQRFKDFIK